MNDKNSLLLTIGVLLFFQLGGMLIANFLFLLDRYYGIRWLRPIGLRPRVRWSLPFFLLSWVALILIQSLLYVVLRALPFGPDDSGRNLALMGSVALANALFVMFAILLSGPGLKKGRAALGLAGPQINDQIIMGCKTAMLAAPWVYATNLLANLIFQNNPHAVMKMLNDGFSPTTATLAAVSAVIMAPLAEEILFRGILLAALIRKSSKYLAANRRFPVQLANVVTSLIFALLHADAWPAPIGIFVLSLVLGKLYISTGRLWPCIAAHALFNSTGVLGMIFAVLAKKSGLAPQELSTLFFSIFT